MSSTNRGSERRDADWYPTPRWCVERLLDRRPELVFGPRGEGWGQLERVAEFRWAKMGIPRLLEPCAGLGAVVHAVNDFAEGQPLDWDLRELRAECGAALAGLGGAVIGDFLDSTTGLAGSKQYDVCITNPPFSLAFEFAKACTRLAHTTAFLLPLGFLGTPERARWFQTSMPSVYVLPNRPAFKGDGKTDSETYAWFVWGGGGCREVHWLDDTPVAIRRADERAALQEFFLEPLPPRQCAFDLEAAGG